MGQEKKTPENFRQKVKNLFILAGKGWYKPVQAQDPLEIFKGPVSQLDKFVTKHQSQKHFIGGYVSYGNPPKVFFAAYDKFEYLASSGSIKKPDKTKFLDRPFTAVWARSKYNKAFYKIKEYISRGHIYQINLTHQLQTQSSRNGHQIFAQLVTSIDSPMMSYFDASNFEILSASPERFVKIESRHIETTPIKGTRARGKINDQELEAELTSSPKEAAELNMITDLLRNDLSAVCTLGSVEVEARKQIQKIDAVMHTYSKISGELQASISPINALLSMAPGGSVTGCPKKRAMEIIDELEPVERGAYCGNMVAIYPDGTLDSSILIRTIIKNGRELILPVGGGIVFDSNLEDEYQETLDKAKSIIDALKD